MKQRYVAAVAMACMTAGVAMAQSSVTLSGVIDSTVAYGHGSLTKKTQLTGSGYNTSRLVFRGTEDKDL